MTKAVQQHRRVGDLEPDPEMWAALDEGRLLKVILKDFYDRVFEDERLAPFFEGVNKPHVIDKQYSFLMQIFTGEDVYFGDRPRNAHHWMVISDELFDYREDVFIEVARGHGIAEHLLVRWRGVHECFRKQIVKDKARPKKIKGVEIPFEGYGELELQVGSLCDGCGAEISPGDLVRYHNRTGRTFCNMCVPGQASTRPPA